jgi:porin
MHSKVVLTASAKPIGGRGAHESGRVGLSGQRASHIREGMMWAPPAAVATAVDAAGPAQRPPAPAARAAGGMSRHDEQGAKPPEAAAPVNIELDPDGRLLGDLGGLRPWLADRGAQLTIRYDAEAAYNASGGNRKLLREAGQLNITAKVDMETLAGLTGGTFQAAVSARQGRDLGADTGLSPLQQVQEVYGRGQTWRLTQFWYEQAFGAVRLKVGRSSPGEDFQGFSCDYENLSLCGSQPGNIVGDYWYNWPISQWAVRVRYDRGGAFAQVGAYEVNPRNLSDGFFNWRFQGAKGVLTPVEVGWSGAVGRAGHVGSFRIGGWWSSADATDLALDVNHQPRFLTGAPPLVRNGRYGAWLSVQQQLTGEARDGKAVSGLSVFLNATQADRETSLTDSQISVGAVYKGLGARRPDDAVGLGLARTNLNSRGLDAASLRPGGLRPDAETVAEVFYNLRVAPWLDLRPNVQFIHHPGGLRDADDATVIGLKAALQL